MASNDDDASPIQTVKRALQLDSSPLPDFTQYADVNAKKQAFFAYLRPVVAVNNQRILDDRARLAALANTFDEALSRANRRFLAGLVDRYEIDTSASSEDQRAEVRQRSVGFIFQSFMLVQSLSALENVMIPQMLNGLDRNEAAKRAEQLMAMVGLEARADHRPGLLSGGEQQRVAIARSMANAPRVLLADEPTGNLDPDTAKDVFHHLSMITRATGTAALVVTHNQQLALNMDSILTISDGKIISIG